MSSYKRGRKATAKNQRATEMARKKDERAVRAAHRREQQVNSAAHAGDTFPIFSVQLGKMGLEIRDIPGDGNCLFRALGDQLEGHGRHHLKHRHDVVEYMRSHREDFEPFVEDDIPFDRHIAMLSKAGTYAGNDCIVAFARIHKVNVVIHQLDSPMWQVHGTEKKDGKQLHISFHNGDHYCSIRKVGDKSESPSNIKLCDPTQVKSSNGAVSSSKSHTNSQKSHQSPNQTGAATWTDGYESPYDNLADWNGDTDSLAAPVSTYTMNEDGVARAYRDISDLEDSVMNATGCTDRELVHQSLLDCSYDLDLCIADVLQVTSICGSPSSASNAGCNGLWSGNGTGTRIFGAADVNSSPSSHSGTAGAKPKQVSTSRRKRDNKLERKARAAERRRQNVAKTGSSSEDDSATVITQSMGTLKI